MSRRIRLSSSSYRMLTTDILPYERPPFFTNLNFANLMKYYGVKCVDGRLIATKHREEVGLKEFLSFLSGSDKIPISSFKYKITKDGIRVGRVLTVIHPRHQIEMMAFYEKYEFLILYYAKYSDFSLRYPYKIARMVKGNDEDGLLISDDKETSLSQDYARHYFSYRRYGNISDFYNDYLYLKLEKQFNYMAQVDICKCFDSIKPEKLVELIFGKDDKCNGVATNFPNKNFATEFAELQKKFNDGGEGIVIGPEFSRIFAELFLQQIEKRVKQRLTLECELTYPKDYRMLRYVDDSFIFANTIEDIQKIVEAYMVELEEVGLRLKTEKCSFYASKPFVNEISIVKDNLKAVLENIFENKLRNFKGFIQVQEGKYTTPTALNFKYFIGVLRNQVASIGILKNADGKNQDILEWSSIEADNKYKDITSFLFGIIKVKLKGLLKDFNSLHREYSRGMRAATLPEKGRDIKQRYESDFVKFCIELIEALFFIFNSDIRMASSLNVVQIVDMLQSFVRGKYILDDRSKSMKFLSEHISKIDEKITDETHQVFRHRIVMNGAGLMEILNLLELQHQMFPRNRVKESVLLRFLERTVSADKITFSFWTIFQLVHFAERKKRYPKILTFAKALTAPIIKRYVESEGSDTEALLMVLELMADPWLDGDWWQLSEYREAFNKLKMVESFLKAKQDLFIVRSNYTVSDNVHLLRSESVY